MKHEQGATMPCKSVLSESPGWLTGRGNSNRESNPKFPNFLDDFHAH